MTASKAVRIANKASAEEIAAAACIPANKTFKDKSLSLRVCAAPSLSESERERIWELWEENMRALVEPSSFGWNPETKKEELFHRDARYILVSDPAGFQERGPIAFSSFRFEEEEGEDVLYCYELQVAGDFRNLGLGHFLMEKLGRIGKHWHMAKVMLTVLKSNVAARRFYSRNGFEVDPTSPEYQSPSDQEDEAESWEDDTYDYEILSKTLL
ncbi:acyl-CoA N-acyltransferase [Trametes cingulata]|nr:acyl-CoA N-acyltransferase [Trametes cingulata]